MGIRLNGRTNAYSSIRENYARIHIDSYSIGSVVDAPSYACSVNTLYG